MASRPRLYDRSLLSLLLQHRDDPLRRFIEERNGAESHRRAERSDKRQARAVYVVPFQRFHALRVLPTLGRSYLLCRAIRSRFTTRRYDVSGPFRRSLTCPDLSRSLLLLLLFASPAAAIPSSPSISTHAIPARSIVPRCKRAFTDLELPDSVPLDCACIHFVVRNRKTFTRWIEARNASANSWASCTFVS